MVGSLLSNRPLEIIASGNWAWRIRETTFRLRPLPCRACAGSRCSGARDGAGGTQRDVDRAEPREAIGSAASPVPAGDSAAGTALVCFAAIRVTERQFFIVSSTAAP